VTRDALEQAVRDVLAERDARKGRHLAFSPELAAAVDDEFAARVADLARGGEQFPAAVREALAARDGRRQRMLFHWQEYALADRDFMDAVLAAADTDPGAGTRKRTAAAGKR
jgi:hypothetical protein